MTRDFNKAISYKGNFDISDILTNLRRLRSELQHLGIKVLFLILIKKSGI